MMKRVIRYIGLFVLGNFLPAYASSFVATSRSVFDHEINTRPYAIVLFYDSSITGRPFEQVASFSRLGDDSLYQAAGLRFIQVDVARRGMKEVADMFELGRLNKPAFALFKQGKVIRGKNGRVVLLRGFQRSAALRDFIDAYLGDNLDAIKVRMRERRYVVRPSYYYAAPYYGPYYYGYPSYWYGGPYYGYYGGGGGIGFGFSFGY